MNEKYIIETKKLTKQYKKQMVINHIDLKIEKGIVFGLLGINGAGKSTLLKMLTCIIKQTNGEIYFEGHPLSRNDLKDIGCLIEMPAIYENLSAYENLKVRALLLNIDLNEIDKILNFVGLVHVGKKKAKQFSLGMKQRLGIALALLNHPKVLILDEPTNGLDPLGIQELRALIHQLVAQGTTVILSSHILSEVELIADEVGIIANGKLGYQGKLNQIDNLEALFSQIVEVNRGYE